MAASCPLGADRGPGKPQGKALSEGIGSPAPTRVDGTPQQGRRGSDSTIYFYREEGLRTGDRADTGRHGEGTRLEAATCIPSGYIFLILKNPDCVLILGGPRETEGKFGSRDGTQRVDSGKGRGAMMATQGASAGKCPRPPHRCPKGRKRRRVLPGAWDISLSVFLMTRIVENNKRPGPSWAGRPGRATHAVIFCEG